MSIEGTPCGSRSTPEWPHNHDNARQCIRQGFLHLPTYRCSFSCIAKSLTPSTRHTNATAEHAKHAFRSKRSDCVARCVQPEPPPPPPIRDLPGFRRRLAWSEKSDDEPHPQDVRLIIWELLIGQEHENDVLHLQRVDGILRHRRCSSEDHDMLPFRHSCWGVF